MSNGSSPGLISRIDSTLFHGAYGPVLLSAGSALAAWRLGSAEWGLWGWLGILCALAGLGLFAQKALERPDVKPRARFLRYQRDIGFALFLMGIVVLLSMVGLAQAGRLAQVFPFPAQDPRPVADDWPEVRDSLTLAIRALEGKDDFKEARARLDEILDDTGCILADLAPSEGEPSETTRQRARDLRKAHFKVDIDLAIPRGLSDEESERVEMALKKTGELLRDLPIYARVDQALRLFFTGLFALFGTLFFIYRALGRKSNAPGNFDVGVFWAGLWFRCGQALLYTLLLFLFLRSDLKQESPGLTEHMLPLFALLIGMYIKTAEGFFEALGELLMRLLESAPSGAGRGEAPGAPAQADLAAWYEQVVAGVVPLDGRQFALRDPAWSEETGTLTVAVDPLGPGPHDPVAAAALEAAVLAHVQAVPAEGIAVEAVAIANRAALVESGVLE